MTNICGGYSVDLLIVKLYLYHINCIFSTVGSNYFIIIRCCLVEDGSCTKIYFPSVCVDHLCCGEIAKSFGKKINTTE